MKEISEGTSAALAAETATLCLCWRIERADGVVFGATDHDRDLTFGGVTYRASHALEGGVFQSTSGLAPGSASAAGGLDADFLDAGELEAGVWNRVRVDVWRVDWSDPSRRARIWSGRIGEVSRSGAGFAAELVSLKADLERTIGRIYSRACDAEVGDARCGVDLDGDGFRAEGEVISADGTRIAASGLSGFAGGWFRSGRLSWISGANAGRSVRVVGHMVGASTVLELASAPLHAPEAGAGFVVRAGCDKAFATCAAKFSNTDNFRGFPHLPGNDALLSGPEGGSADDGGSRR